VIQGLIAQVCDQILLEDFCHVCILPANINIKRAKNKKTKNKKQKVYFAEG
jgi:hypothetical protein